MDSTSAQGSLQVLSGVLRTLVGAVIVVAFAAVLAGTNGLSAGKAHAGAASKITVNSTSNSDDGDCEGTPNDHTIGGDCTLTEAINDANDGLAEVINFQPSVFRMAFRGRVSVHALALRANGCPALAGHPTRTLSRPHAAHGGVLRTGPPISCR